MSYTPELIAELEILSLFNLGNTREGLKIHHDATPENIEAAQRLFAKKLITQPDGGYLTSLGLAAAQQAQGLLQVLSQPQAA